MAELSRIDKRLLEMLQEGLPLESRPFKRLAGKLGLIEAQVLERVERLKREKVIRRIGGVWDAARMGYFSVLVALQVAPEHLEEVACRINSYPGVTHNYQREHRLNLWFTLTSSDCDNLRKILLEVDELPGVAARYYLPARQRFKVEVKFNWEEEGDVKHPAEGDN